MITLQPHESTLIQIRPNANVRVTNISDTVWQHDADVLITHIRKALIPHTYGAALSLDDVSDSYINRKELFVRTDYTFCNDLRDMVTETPHV